MLVTGNPGVPVPAAAAAAAQKLMRTDRLEVGMTSWCLYVMHSNSPSVFFCLFVFPWPKSCKNFKTEILA